jgi:hypothetical protein
MNAHRKALIVANDEYEHEGLGQLSAPAADAQALAGVLGDEQIGDFDVQIVRNEPAHVIQALIEELFSEARPDDVLLVHFSCHGLKSESGELFFAAANTRPNRLGSTAVSADFVQRCLRTSRSRSVVLLLDCCYGGAFARGVSVRAAGDVDVLGSFPPERAGSGRGRAVITASSAMEYAFEGDRLSDDAGPQPSVFTSALVEGLATGEADRNQDGWVSLDELYEYVFDKVRERNPNQTPSRDVEMQGDLFIARRSRPVTTPAPLPPELRMAIDSPLAGVRGGAVEELARVLRTGHAGLVLAARMALEGLAEDDSRHVSAAAAAALRQSPAVPAPAATMEPTAVAPHPATEPADAAEPAIPESAAAEPAIPEPAALKPAIPEAAAPEPATVEPASAEPAVPEAAAAEAAATEPASTESATAGLVAAESTALAPAVALVIPESAPAAPASPEPSMAAPATQELAAAGSAAAATTPAPLVVPAPAPEADAPVTTGAAGSAGVRVAPEGAAASPATDRIIAPAKAEALAEPGGAAAASGWIASPLLLVTGVLTLIEAALLVASVYPVYAASYHLLSYPVNVASLFINAAVLLAAGICLLIRPTSRLVGTGLLIGGTVTTPTDLQGTLAALGRDDVVAGPGAKLIIVACILGLVTIVLAVLSLWRGRDIRFARPALAAVRGQAAAWVVAALGVAGAAAFAIQVAPEHYLPGDKVHYISGGITVPIVWITLLALALPALAVAARPRSFGVALAAGWVGIGLSEVVFDIGLPTSVTGYTLVAMAIALIPLARTAPPDRRAASDRQSPAGS